MRTLILTACLLALGLFVSAMNAQPVDAKTETQISSASQLMFRIRGGALAAGSLAEQIKPQVIVAAQYEEHGLPMDKVRKIVAELEGALEAAKALAEENY